MRLLILISILLHTATASLRCNCKKATCHPVSLCIAGTRMDICNCCKVCAKIEGDSCGGDSYHMPNECGDNLRCKVTLTNRNVVRDYNKKTAGVCEHVTCQSMKCRSDEVCLIETGVPTCQCPVCVNRPKEVVCGERNNLQYDNECELRRDECVTQQYIGMKVGKCYVPPSTDITCGENRINITIAKSFIKKHHQKTLSLTDSTCLFQQNATHFYISTKFNKCGTRRVYGLRSVIYTNEARTINKNNPFIIRRKDLQIPFQCEYNIGKKYTKSRGKFGDRVNEKLRSNGLGVRIRVDIPRSTRSTGEISIDINPTYRYLVVLQPLRLGTNSYIYPKFCYATPVSKTQRWMRYTLVENGCSVENGVEILETRKENISLMVPSIRFHGARYPGVLIRCKITKCITNNSNACRNIFQCKNNSNTRKRRNINALPLLYNTETVETKMLPFSI